MSREKSGKKPSAPDYKPYPKEEDMYRQGEEIPFEEEEDSRQGVDNEDDTANDDLEDFPEEMRHLINSPEDDSWNTENFDTDHTGDDLDVPGSELDDEQEDIGSEDEENNYYSLGGPRIDD